MEPSRPTAAAVTFEDILELVGGTGRWQAVVMCWAAVVIIVVPLHSLGSVFLSGDSEHRCAIPGENRSVTAEEELLTLWIPRDNATGRWSRCERYSAAGRHDDVVSCDRWIYNQDDVHEAVTIVQQWDLVCERQWLRSTVQSSYMLGCLVGSLIIGILSDHYGRKRAICVSSVVFIVTSIGAAFSNSYIAFMVLRFISAMPRGGLFCTMFILCVELGGPTRRASIGLLFNLPYATGVMLLSCIGYFVRGWFLFQLTISVLALPQLVYWFVLPESPRWLILHGRLDEAMKELKNAARWNRRDPPNETVLMEMMQKFRQAELAPNDTVAEKKFMNTCLSILSDTWSLISTSRMRRVSLVHFFNWLVVAMVYYGVTFDAAKLSSSAYLSIFLSGLLEIPAYILALPTVSYFGRRTTVIITHSIAAVSLLLILLVPSGQPGLKLALNMIGRFATTACYGVIYLYSSECFPTVLRNFGIGACGVFEDLGSILAPYAVDLLGEVHWSIPSLLFGTSACMAAVAILFTPETTNKHLPDTVTDVKNNWSSQKTGTILETHTNS